MSAVAAICEHPPGIPQVNHAGTWPPKICLFITSIRQSVFGKYVVIFNKYTQYYEGVWIRKNLSL